MPIDINEYKKGDTLICNREFKTRISSTHKRGFEIGDKYKVYGVANVSLYIKNMDGFFASYDEQYGGLFPIDIKWINGYFSCLRVERKLKLKQLEDVN